MFFQGAKGVPENEEDLTDKHICLNLRTLTQLLQAQQTRLQMYPKALRTSQVNLRVILILMMPARILLGENKPWSLFLNLWNDFLPRKSTKYLNQTFRPLFIPRKTTDLISRFVLGIRIWSSKRWVWIPLEGGLIRDKYLIMLNWNGTLCWCW